jgi:hypothetical protein
MVLESSPPENRITAGALGFRGAMSWNAADKEDMAK